MTTPTTITIQRVGPDIPSWAEDRAWLAEAYCDAIAEELTHSWVQTIRRVDRNRRDEIMDMLSPLLLQKDRACLLVARHAAARVGYFLGLVKDCVAEVPAAVGYVNGLYVATEYRRLGIAGHLYTEGRKWFAAQGLTAVELYTAVGNAAASAFWRKHGFCVTEEVMVARLGESPLITTTTE
ncbi:MAG: GNAT family N-acetyltransferase [Deltaproteobacteria bacterium]|nr:GNAT family N-acetyltransferase [Deltaproteobacteria bacterium]